MRRVDDLLSRCTLLPAIARTAELYARLRMNLKQAGSPIPQNDIWIAASCIEHAVRIASGDAHFGNVKGLDVVNVLRP